jgi:hypothetical protein
MQNARQSGNIERETYVSLLMSTVGGYDWYVSGICKIKSFTNVVWKVEPLKEASFCHHGEETAHFQRQHQQYVQQSH